MRPLNSIVDNVRCKIAARRKIGFFDYHPLSYDQRLARARALRIWARVARGKRLTLRQALEA